MTTKLIAADASAGAILDPSVGDGALVIQTGAAGAKVDAISITADGTPTFLKVPKNTAVQSMVRVNTANGYGSTNTVIRRFTNVVTNQGTDITYADSVTLGATFTVNTNGVYAVSYADSFSVATGIGLSLNSTQLTTGFDTITVADRLISDVTNTATQQTSVSTTLYLSSGDVIRAHVGAANAVGDAARAQFTITRVA